MHRPLPSEVNRWWRNRLQMTLVPDGDGWRIEGEDHERARVAFATLDGGGVTFEVAPAAVGAPTLW
jgi:hypothetical protein